jgi:hypothetical protein
MGWFRRLAKSDRERVSDNIDRLTSVRGRVKELSDFALASPGGAFEMLQRILAMKVIQGREKVEGKLKEALFGEDRQKIALDAPRKFRAIMLEAVALLDLEINTERSYLKELEQEESDGKSRITKGLQG